MKLFSWVLFGLGLLAFFYLKLEKKELDIIARMACAGFGGLMCACGWQVRKAAQRAAQLSAEELIATDSRRPVLLLRAFDRDGEHLPAQEESFREGLGKDLAAHFLVVPKVL
ncbi:MAG: hypothetical protein MJE77_22260 [Proteobacteria bacterium]|nr:hypothetical protein [Pseudomonadota bacterium]